MNHISCSIGAQNDDSIRSDDNMMSPNQSVEGPKLPEASSTSVNSTSQISSKSNSKSKLNEAEISEMSCDSLVWLSHRLGPVLTARYLTRNLLKMLTLCYVGKENLEAAFNEESMDSSFDMSDFITITNSYVLGDKNATKVLECLSSIAGM